MNEYCAIQSQKAVQFYSSSELSQGHHSITRGGFWIKQILYFTFCLQLFINFTLCLKKLFFFEGQYIFITCPRDNYFFRVTSFSKFLFQKLSSPPPPSVTALWLCKAHHTIKTIHWPPVGSMLDHRLRLCPNIEPTLGQYILCSTLLAPGVSAALQGQKAVLKHC